MRLFLLSSFLATSAVAQWYAEYPPYPNPRVIMVFPPSEPIVVVNETPHPLVREYSPRAVTYLIAFADHIIRQAETYWVKDCTLYYVTPDHNLRTAPVTSVDRAFSEQLNYEQNVAFALPPLSPVFDRLLTLERQLNSIIETRCTAGGLVVGIPDVLFEFNRYTLTAVAREKLAKIAIILLSYENLSIRLDGHTDNTGGDQYNIQLSRKRADAVRDYLVSQGVSGSSMITEGLGSANPVAPNTTEAGRHQNRRVDMLLSGDVIGVPVTSARVR